MTTAVYPNTQLEVLSVISITLLSNFKLAAAKVGFYDNRSLVVKKHTMNNDFLERYGVCEFSVDAFNQ